MNLTKDIILKIGFSSKYPDRVIGTYELNEFGKYRINIIAQFKPMINNIIFDCDCNKINSNGIVVKRAYLSNINTVEELQKLFELCEIDFNIDSKFLS